MATSSRRKVSTSDVLSETVRRRARTSSNSESSEQEARLQAISPNTFFKIIFGEGTPQEKKKAMAKALVFEGTKAENKARIEEFEQFKEYLQTERKEMDKELIKLTDTDAFAQLKKTYGDLNNGLVEFEESIKPLTDILDAVYKMRTEGNTLEAFKAIRADRERERAREVEMRTVQSEFERLKANINTINNEIAELNEEKSFFGFGGVTKEARVEIARRSNDLVAAQDELTAISGKITLLQNEAAAHNSGEDPEFTRQKDELRKLLDISTDEHSERQKKLVESALNFVNVSQERINENKTHLGQMNNQISGLDENNGTLTSVYAIANEAVKEAKDENQKKREALLVAPPDEDLISKMSREANKTALEEHITTLDVSATDTLLTYADLTAAAINIKEMKSKNLALEQGARQLGSRGIAGVAGRLNTILQAVSGAALGEASEMARSTLNQMMDSTNAVAQKEAIKNAMAIGAQNQDIVSAIDSLAEYGETMKTATDISREGITEAQSLLAQLEELSVSTKADLADNIAVHAEAGSKKKSVPTAKGETKATGLSGLKV